MAGDDVARCFREDSSTFRNSGAPGGQRARTTVKINHGDEKKMQTWISGWSAELDAESIDPFLSNLRHPWEPSLHPEHSLLDISISRQML